MDRESFVQELQSYHLPRWEELPDIELYADQVIHLIEKYLAPLYDTDEVIITGTMINNYTKSQVTPRPDKKRYNRVHLANLIIITLLKQSFSLPEIRQGLTYQKKLMPASEAYDFFCEMQEAALKLVVSGERTLPEVYQHIPVQGAVIVPFAALTLAAKLMTKQLVKWEASQDHEDTEVLINQTKEIKEMFYHE